VREKEKSMVAMRKAKKRAYRKLHVTTTLFTNLIPRDTGSPPEAETTPPSTGSSSNRWEAS